MNNPWHVTVTVGPSDKLATEERLVNARTAAAAIAHVVAVTVTCERASAAVLMRLAKDGVVIEDAT